MTNASNDMSNPVLIVVEGPLAGRQWVLENDSQVIIGRGGSSDIVLPERRISREHLRIWRKEGRSFIKDLDSKNGTHVNGVLLEDVQELVEGDEIQIALSIRLRFVGAEATVPLTLEHETPVSQGLHLDPHTRQVIIKGKLLEPQLSLYQYRLLDLLYSRGGGVCTRDDVVSAVWPDAMEEGVSEQAIDALVRRLRDRIAEIDPEYQYIVTVRGHGFRFDQP
nr:FHA domain-containing protein [Anaerolineae bacterium]